MQSDDRQDAASGNRGSGNHQGRYMCAYQRERLPGCLPQLNVTAPPVQERGKAGDQDAQWQGDQEHPESQPRLPRIPSDDLLGGVRRLVLLRLHVAHEECGHEQDCRENEQQLGGSDGVLG